MTSDQRQALADRIRQGRDDADLTLRELQAKLRATGLNRGTSIQHLSEVQRGDAWPSRDLVSALDSVLSTNGQLIALLRNAKVPAHADSSTESLIVTAHLFFPLFVDAAPEPMHDHASSTLDFVPRLGHTTSHMEHAVLHSFPFRVVVLHERHNFAEADLTAIAAWRQEQILRSRTAVTDHAAELDLTIAPMDHDPYCFTAFVLNAVPWDREQLQNRATQILAMPGVLLASHAGDDVAHRAKLLLASTSPLADVVDFSHTGSHFGAASWAAVSILPTERTSTVATALVEFEVQLQAFWCYASNIEASGEFVHADYDARFLRRVLGKLQCPWPTEHTAVRRLREAILHTSRITELVGSAILAVPNGKRT